MIYLYLSVGFDKFAFSMILYEMYLPHSCCVPDLTTNSRAIDKIFLHIHSQTPQKILTITNMSKRKMYI